MPTKTEQVEHLLRAFWASDWDATMAPFAEDAVYEDPLLAEPAVGKTAILEVFRYCHEWGRLQGSIRNLIESDRCVAAELRIQGTVIGPIEGMSPNVVGKTFDFVEADVFEFNAEGLITRETIYPDVGTLLKQLDEPGTR